MYDYNLHQSIHTLLKEQGIQADEKDNLFYVRFMANASALEALFFDLYGYREDSRTHVKYGGRF